MWVVYKSADHEGTWGHTYFNEEANAREYYNEHNTEIWITVEIEEIKTEDGPNRDGALED